MTDFTVGMRVRVDSVRLGVPFIGRVTMVHRNTPESEPNGILRVEVTEPLASRYKPGDLVDVGSKFCVPQTED